ncbi:MAG TPA: recombination mediator RecR [Candidatus Babeliales bacterium]|jgi:recombination protein RecR|nr:recombination mediator RecR [Candidatus Babeliales bacterium]
MLEELPTLAHLLKILQQVPYLASKNLYRVAAHFLEMQPQQIAQFCAALEVAKERLKKCDSCFYWQESSATCIFCSSSKRDQSIVCVVETWQEILAIEKTRGYLGVYHVLGGSISPLEGVSAEDLTIDQLLVRAENGIVKELILATNQTPEGEATATYIARKLKGKNIIISCLARGLPVGSSLEGMDRLTVFKALSERRPF